MIRVMVRRVIGRMTRYRIRRVIRIRISRGVKGVRAVRIKNAMRVLWREGFVKDCAMFLIRILIGVSVNVRVRGLFRDLVARVLVGV
jgi:hypothetical protein